MDSSFSRSAFVRSTLLPLIWLFAIPAFAFWFYGHAAERYDAPYYAQLESAIAQKKVEPRAADFWRNHPPSKVCASDDSRLKKLRHKLPCISYGQFAWGQRVAGGSIALGFLGVLLIGLLVAASLRSQRAQYLSFRIGWVLLKLISTVQVIAQGVLLVGLSYWVTAIWFKIYVPKLIGIVGLLALGAMALVIKAIFKRIPQEAPGLSGKLLEEHEAPELWQRIRQLCAELGTVAPRQIVVGIDANFFVTEHRLMLGERELSGRTLFISLPLLKALERGEADAVLAHEMAHFSGDDTLYSRKLAPLLDRYVHYLHALRQGAISLPIFYFMLAYWALFQLSLSRTSRQREFRADAIAAERSSPDAMASALLKIAAYCAFRAKVEDEIVGADALDPELGVATRLAQGFVGFVRSPELDALFAHDPQNFGHPFDSHPPLSQRLEAVGTSIRPEAYRDRVLEEASDSWFSTIEGAGELEEGQWKAHEEMLQLAHQQLLAFRMQPQTEEEQALVELSFPPLTFEPVKGNVSVKMNYKELWTSEAGSVGFGDIRTAQLTEQGFGRYLVLTLYGGGNARIRLDRLEGKGQPFLAEFDRYYGRYLTAEQHLAQEEAVAQSTPAAL